MIFYPHTLRVHTPDFPRLTPTAEKPKVTEQPKLLVLGSKIGIFHGCPWVMITLRRQRFRSGHQQRSTKCRFCCQRTPGGNGTGVSDSCVRWVGWNGVRYLGVKIHGELWYCWWTKSCTTKDDDYPIIYRVLTIPGGAGFCPSTVWIMKSFAGFSISLGFWSYRTGDGRLLWWLGFRTLCNFQSDAGGLIMAWHWGTLRIYEEFSAGTLWDRSWFMNLVRKHDVLLLWILSCIKCRDGMQEKCRRCKCRIECCRYINSEWIEVFRFPCHMWQPMVCIVQHKWSQFESNQLPWSMPIANSF